ncbi:hypothetical protein PEC18_05315 [Paucibacter sp. O1-1]|nr:hypothetical protein [Paucibacter sp. O1-1]MDA3825288.1 hypothetical protein [Paucibacter sp. O1-1]
MRTRRCARVGRLLSDDNLDQVTATLHNINDITHSLAEERQALGGLMDELAAAGLQLRRTLARVEKLAESADRTLVRDAGPLLESARAWIASAQRTTDTATSLLVETREPITRFADSGLAQLAPAIVELRTTLAVLGRCLRV